VVKFRTKTAVARFVVVARCRGRKITLKVYRQRRRWSAARRRKTMKKLNDK
jgi:hypothetical protein